MANYEISQEAIKSALDMFYRVELDTDPPEYLEKMAGFLASEGIGKVDG